MSEYISWEQRDGWTDITPIPQADSQDPLVPINYSPEYVSAMSAFRYIQSKQEISRRGLDLTADIVRMNPAHYTVWAYRSKTLLALRKSEEDGDQLLIKELDILDELVKVHLKNYQVWQHRRIIVSDLNDPSKELPFTTRALALDAKNYHTWAYRQWALSHFYSDRMVNKDVWDKELQFASSLLIADVRNNSAWNHRWFTVFGDSQPADKAVTERELAYTKKQLDMAPNNPSAWNYLRGILDRFSLPYSEHISWAEGLRSPVAPENNVTLAVEFVADALESSKDVDRMAQIYDSLATQLDPMRKGYWEWRKGQLTVTGL